MTNPTKPKAILFDPTVLQWSGPDGRPIDNPFKRVPGPSIFPCGPAATLDDKAGISV
jgi:hypothetical protein